VESVVGRERLDRFLRDYFDHFAFQPMSSERMVAYMKEKLLSPEEQQRINLQSWIFEPGLPANIPPVRSEKFAAIEQQVTAWKNGGAASAIQTKDWSTQEWLHFLRALPDTIPVARMAELDSALHLSSSGNSEILFQWLRMSIRNRYEAAFPALERFLKSQGRRKYIAPLYAELAKTDWGKAMAMKIYRQARPTYHSVATTTIDKTLGWNK
jgi:leukotriene-A4 hydrolase